MTATSAQEAIALANRNFMDVFRQGDAAAVARCYTVDGQVLPPQSEPISGRAGIEAFWRAVLGMGIAGVALESVELAHQGDSVFEVGRYSLTTAAGTVADRGKYVVIWRMEGDGWKLHRDIWNTSIPPSA